MSQPPQDGDPGQPPEGPPDPGSPDYDGAPDGPARRGAHRAGGRPTPPPPPPAGAPYWPQPDYQPKDEPSRRRGSDLPGWLLTLGAALLAVIVVVLVIVGVNVFRGKSTSSDTATPRLTHTSALGAGTTAAGGGTTASPTTAGPTTAGPTTPAVKPTTQPAAKPTTKPTTAPGSKPTTAPGSKPTTKPTATVKPTPKPAVTTAAPPPPNVKAPLTVYNNSRIRGLASVGAATFTKQGWDVVGQGNLRGRWTHPTAYYTPGNEAAAQSLARSNPSITVVAPKPAGLPGSAVTVVLTRDFKP